MCAAAAASAGPVKGFEGVEGKALTRAKLTPKKEMAGTTITAPPQNRTTIDTNAKGTAQIAENPHGLTAEKEAAAHGNHPTSPLGDKVAAGEKHVAQTPHPESGVAASVVTTVKGFEGTERGLQPKQDTGVQAGGANLEAKVIYADKTIKELTDKIADLKEKRDKAKPGEKRDSYETQIKQAESSKLQMQKQKDDALQKVSKHWVSGVVSNPKEGKTKLESLDGAIKETKDRQAAIKERKTAIDSDVEKIDKKFMTSSKDKEAKRELEVEGETLDKEKKMLSYKQMALEQARKNEALNTPERIDAGRVQTGQIHAKFTFGADSHQSTQLASAINGQVVGNPNYNLGKVISDIARTSDRMTIIDQRRPEGEQVVKQQSPTTAALPNESRVNDIKTTLAFLDEKGKGEGKLKLSFTPGDYASAGQDPKKVTEFSENQLGLKAFGEHAASSPEERGAITSTADKAKAEANAKGKTELNTGHLRELRSCTQEIYSGLLNEAIVKEVGTQAPDKDRFMVVANLAPKSIERTILPDGSTDVKYNMEFEVQDRGRTVDKETVNKDGTKGIEKGSPVVEHGAAVLTIHYNPQMEATSVTMNSQPTS